MRRTCGLIPVLARRLALYALALPIAAVAAQPGDAAPPDRIARLNQAFLDALDHAPAEQKLAIESIRAGWRDVYRDQSPAGFVPDALAILHPAFAQAMEAFDRGDSAQVLALVEPLRASMDQFLAVNAGYLRARALIDLGQLEEAQAALGELTADERAPADFTPYAPHLWFMRAYCEAANLRFDDAAQTLKHLGAAFGEVPEAVQVGARQMLLELERREAGTLGDVSSVMQYVAQRLSAQDADANVRDRQQQILDMLDKLIAEQEQQERESQARGMQARARGQQGRGPSDGSIPASPAERSEESSGQGRIGELHGAPKARPGEAWGQLPPAEREKILQSLRERFPSRYRQLVEQYYRSLAEEKR
jgi:hypothetical protein